jgi:hypothetical protein
MFLENSYTVFENSRMNGVGWGVVCVCVRECEVIYVTDVFNLVQETGNTIVCDAPWTLYKYYTIVGIKCYFE